MIGADRPQLGRRHDALTFSGDQLQPGTADQFDSTVDDADVEHVPRSAAGGQGADAKSQPLVGRRRHLGVAQPVANSSVVDLTLCEHGHRLPLVVVLTPLDVAVTRRRHQLVTNVDVLMDSSAGERQVIGRDDDRRPRQLDDESRVDHAAKAKTNADHDESVIVAGFLSVGHPQRQPLSGRSPVYKANVAGVYVSLREAGHVQLRIGRQEAAVDGMIRRPVNRDFQAFRRIVRVHGSE